VRDTGVLTTFLSGERAGLSEMAPEIPYVSAQILSTVRTQHVLRPHPRDSRRRRAQGQRVEGRPLGRRAKPDPTSIQWFEQTGEEEGAPYDLYKDY